MPVSKVLRANPRPSDGKAILHLCQHQDQILPRGVRAGLEADLSEELIEVKPEFMGFNNTGYPGAFPPRVESRIRAIAESPCLHLFSGRSKIGDVRVDFDRPEATRNVDVLEFLKTEKRDWKFVIADPPYDVPAGRARHGLEVLLNLRLILLPVKLRRMARVLDYRQPFVLSLNLDSCGLGWCLTVKPHVGSEIVVEDLHSINDG